MQYSLPQFIEVEDKIIGPLTLKQFLILLFGGLIGVFFWSIFKLSLMFFLAFLPTIGIFALLAFGKINGRPALFQVPAFFRFFSAPKIRIYQRLGEKTLAIVKKPKISQKAPETLEPEEVQSRLRKLAYILDQKTAEEERLIHSKEMQTRWLNQI